MSRHALIAGATGLIGSHLLKLLLADSRYDRVTVLVRRPLKRPHAKLHEIVTDYSDLARHSTELAVDDVFCCLGTTRAKAGSKQAFEAVDYGLVMALAKATREAGARQFLLVSAVGASPRATAFYSRVKGRVELDLRRLDFEALHIVRPSLLLGERDESRPLEALAQIVAPYLTRLVQRSWPRYAPVSGEEVAAALRHAALSGQRGVHVHEAPFAVSRS
jgi:uncharacterized protein YbjT (DUF2867 family)